MTDYQRIADEIREFLEGEDQTLDPHVSELAQSYADACKAANARLRRCGDLLRRGLRSEAIGVAQQAPDLLDVVAALDLPGLADWETVCSTYSLPRPPRLLMEVAAELNDAYATVEPLEASLDELRLLALARAPAYDRLLVVRRLRALDADTPHWTDDARDLEWACLAGIRQDVARVASAGDAVAAHRLAEALTSPDWITPPPRELIEPLARLELQGLAQDMEHARGANDASRVRRAVEAIRKTAARRKVALPADHAAAIGEVDAWLAEQAQIAEERGQFHEICGQLEAAIYADAPLSTLEMLHAQARAYNLPMPARVAELYMAAAREKRTVADRAKRRNLALIAVAVVAVAAGTWYVMEQSRTAAAARGAVARIEQAIAQYDFAAGQRAWEAIQAKSPDLAARPQLAGARARLTIAEQVESRRASQFADALAGAEAADMTTSVRLMRIGTAESLARLDSERLKVRTLRRQIESQQPSPVPATPPLPPPRPADGPATPTTPAQPTQAPQSSSPGVTVTPTAQANPELAPARPARPVASPDRPAAPSFDRAVTISAKLGVNDAGLSLGPVRAGQRITMRFVSGQWTNTRNRGFPPGNPDAEPVPHHCVMRPRLCEVEPGGAVRALITLPGQTSERPFEFAPDHDVANLVLNQEDPWPDNNLGEVVYHVTIR